MMAVIGIYGAGVATAMFLCLFCLIMAIAGFILRRFGYGKDHNGRYGKIKRRGCPSCGYTGSLPCHCDGGYVQKGTKITRCTRCLGSARVTCQCGK